MIIPFRTRELLVWTDNGTCLSHTFEGLTYPNDVDTDPITPAGTFSFVVPTEKIGLQVARIYFELATRLGDERTRAHALVNIGSARLKPDAMQLLRLIASRIGTFPNDVVIEGHTDSRPYTRAGYNNWDLSTDRANSARRVIEEAGIRERQITSINGYADRRLKNPDKPMDYSNRRVTILVAFSASLGSEPKTIAPAAAPLVQKPIIVGRS